MDLLKKQVDEVSFSGQTTAKDQYVCLYVALQRLDHRAQYEPADLAELMLTQGWSM